MARARLALLLVAAASRGAQPSLDVETCNGRGGGAVQECQEEETTALLQHARGRRRGPDTPAIPKKVPEKSTEITEKVETLELAPKDAVPLCHEGVVAEACQKMNDGDGEEAYVSADTIRELMSANSSAISYVWNVLGLSSLGGKVSCMDLCGAVVGQMGRVMRLPPASDTACYLVDGETKCDVDVRPRKLVEDFRTMFDDVPDNGPEVDYGEDEAADASRSPGLVQTRIIATRSGLRRVRRRFAAARAGSAAIASGGANTSAGGRQMLGRRRSEDRPWWIPYSLWESLMRLGSFFGIYPASTTMATTEWWSGKEAAGDVQQHVAKAFVQARAWVSAVLLEMGNMNTAPMRAEWFGGPGPMSASEVRQRLLRAMNFVDRELGSIRYVFPADDSADTACNGGAVAYVWKSNSNDGNVDYMETEGPVCESWQDPMDFHCALDGDGHYFVYLCQAWFDAVPGLQVSTLVHEAIHHTGPTDVTYDSAVAKKLPQAQQLDNAASYERFAQEVATAAWGCADNNPLVLSFSCSPGVCTCGGLSRYCDDPTFGPEVRTQCPGSCGRCLAPISGTDACKESTALQTVAIGQKLFRGYCASFSYEGGCTEPSVRRACPISCGICTRRGCEDSPTFTSSVSGDTSGNLTCQDWWGCDECPETVAAACPTACLMDGCMR